MLPGARVGMPGARGDVHRTLHADDELALTEEFEVGDPANPSVRKV